MFLSYRAEAAAITNLSESPKRIEMRVYGGFTPVVIAPGETWRVIGMAVIRYDGVEFHIADNEEFAVWPDGLLAPQRRLRHISGLPGSTA